jgi:hypothetical protein
MCTECPTSPFTLFKTEVALLFMVRLNLKQFIGHCQLEIRASKIPTPKTKLYYEHTDEKYKNELIYAHT